MQRIIISGRAAVSRDDEQIDDPAVLRTLDGLAYDDERFTDYLGGPGEDELAAALESGGVLRFSYREGEPLLEVRTEYRSRRPLSPAELALLVEYTMGQWSDGIGENLTCESRSRWGFSIMCLIPGDGVGSRYPDVRVAEGPLDD